MCNNATTRVPHQLHSVCGSNRVQHELADENNCILRDDNCYLVARYMHCNKARKKHKADLQVTCALERRVGLRARTKHEARWRLLQRRRRCGGSDCLDNMLGQVASQGQWRRGSELHAHAKVGMNDSTARRWNKCANANAGSETRCGSHANRKLIGISLPNKYLFICEIFAMGKSNCNALPFKVKKRRKWKKEVRWESAGRDLWNDRYIPERDQREKHALLVHFRRGSVVRCVLCLALRDFHLGAVRIQIRFVKNEPNQSCLMWSSTSLACRGGEEASQMDLLLKPHDSMSSIMTSMMNTNYVLITAPRRRKRSNQTNKKKTDS